MSKYYVYQRAPNAHYPFWHYHYVRTTVPKSNLPNILHERPVYVYDDITKTYSPITGFLVEGVTQVHYLLISLSLYLSLILALLPVTN